MDAIESHVLGADLVVGAVLVPGAAAPKLVSREMVARMQRGSHAEAFLKLLGRIRFPNHVSNMCWGEDDWKTLFITDHHRVYRTRVKVPGVAVW